jgi:sugar lactone lactonase YvrE
MSPPSTTHFSGEGRLADGHERHPLDSVRRAIRSSDDIAVIDGGDQLGEGPFWDADRGELLRVDVARGLVHGWDPASGASWRRQVDGEVGAVVPRVAGPGFVLAVGHQILLDDGDALRELGRAEDTPDNRFNDCACDPGRRFRASPPTPRRKAPSTR